MPRWRKPSLKKTQAGMCPMCEDRDYYGDGAAEDVELENVSRF